MLIKHHLLAALAVLGVTAALLRPTPSTLAASELLDRHSLEAGAGRSAEAGDRAAAAHRRAQAIDAERLRLIARGALTAREATPAELRLIRSGGVPRAAATP